MKNWTLSALLISSFLLLAGCGSNRVISKPGIDYDSLGTLEYHLSTTRPIARILTLGIIRRYSYTQMQKRLSKKIADQAHDQYGADAVANMTFWPEPGADAKLDMLYGRGEMIRYKKFAEA